MEEIKNRLCSCCGAEIEDFWAFRLIRVSGGQEHLTEKNSFFSLELCEACKQRLETLIVKVKPKMNIEDRPRRSRRGL